MKRNKKGFTLVELVIVIAVIAILAAVLLPTFSNVIENAKQSSATQVATNAWKTYYSDTIGNGGEVKSLLEYEGYSVIVDNTGSQDYIFTVDAKGALTNITKGTYTADTAFTVSDTNQLAASTKVTDFTSQADYPTVKIFKPNPVNP